MRALLLTALPLACAWAPLPGIGDSAQRHANRRLARPAAASRPAWAGRSGVARPMGLLDTFLAKGVDEDDIARIALERDNEKIAGVYDALVARVNAAEKTVEKLDDAGVRAAAEALRADAAALAADAREPDDLRVQGLALAREAAWRVLRQRPYDVQLVGGLALLDGRLAEMATGEGKTLAAVGPTFLAASRGRGACVVTASDYLAKRDAETVGQVYRFLGLTVGVVQQSDDAAARAAAYACDVTYVSNSELGFDYLRDNLALSAEEKVARRDPYFCLVDEADSILIDEARTPLIISKPTASPAQKFAASRQLAEYLTKGTHYNVDEKAQSATLLEAGYDECEAVLKKNIFDPRDPWAPFIDNALKAKELFMKDRDYLVRAQTDDPSKLEVAIVDVFSGRVLEGRRWSDGLHQSVEVKEGLPVSDEALTIATITYQALFKRYPRLCGMSGTAMPAASELLTVYGLPVTPIPTALPSGRKDYPDVVYRSMAAKTAAVVTDVARVHASGRPVLVGTTSVEASEALAAALKKERNLDATVLNAKPDAAISEAAAIAQAGRPGTVTVSTNMAGRGTDILLGGNANAMAKLVITDALGGDKGPADDYYPCALSAEAAALVAEAKAANAKGPARSVELLVATAAEAVPVPEGDATCAAVRAAYTAVKGEYAEALAPEKAKVLELGGLYIVGTSRHESRRIDAQLRGRAGRQGDPGGSRFFLSLDDDVFRLFGADKIKGLMEAFRLGDDIPMEAPSIMPTLDGVQDKVELYFADIRNTVYQYDQVLAMQRDAVYVARSRTLDLDAAAARAAALDFAAKTATEIVPGYLLEDGAANCTGLSAKLSQFLGPWPGAAAAALAGLAGGADGPLGDAVRAAAAAAMTAKLDALDAVRPTLASETVRYLSLVQTDNLWQTHLQQMKYLQESVQLLTYKGLSPLDEYQRRGAELFGGLVEGIRRNTLYSVMMYQPVKK